MAAIVETPPKLSRWLGAIRGWFNNGRPFWLTLLVLLVVLLGAHLVANVLPFTLEQRIRFAGVVLEFCGLWVIATEFARAQAAFGGSEENPLAAFWSWAKQYFLGFPRWPRDVTVRAMTGQAGGFSSGVIGTATGTVGGKLTLARRVELLEALQKEDRTEIARVGRELNQHREETREQIERERREREEADRKAAERHKTMATGGIPAQAMGWVWIVCGAFLANLSQEIAALAQRLGLA